GGGRGGRGGGGRRGGPAAAHEDDEEDEAGDNRRRRQAGHGAAARPLDVGQLERRQVALRRRRRLRRVAERPAFPELGEGRGQRPAALVAGGGDLGQRARDDAVDGGGQAGLDLRRRRRALVHDLAEDRHHAVGAEGEAAREQPVEDRAEGELVAAGAHVVAEGLLWGHV